LFVDDQDGVLSVHPAIVERLVRRIRSCDLGVLDGSRRAGVSALRSIVI